MVIAAGEGEQKVFSRLDLARHAALLVVYMMGMSDTLAIVTFSANAQVLLPPTKMTAGNKERAKELLQSLRPDSSTNLKAGLRKAFTTVALIPDANILVLTDGEADTGKDLGMLSDEIPKDYRGTLSTVGFTYASKSDILYGLATAGRGSFGFVSSSDMLMTVILNWISRQLANEAPAPPSKMILDYITVLRKAYDLGNTGSYRDAQTAINVFGKNLPAGSVLREDIKGDVSLAVSKEDTFRKWGCHHYLALISSHENGHCGNFKDPSVQSYATSRFKAIQKKGITVFEDDLPPLKGSLAVSEAARDASALSGHAASAAFYDPRGGCFHGDSRITLIDGSVRPIHEIRSGMVVMTREGPATVVTAIKYCVPSGSMEMTKVNDELIITPWHPIIKDGEWVFPYDHYSTSLMPVSAVYNLALNTAHHVLVGGVVCCTLGHGLKGPVIEHSYFGTDAVLKDLQSHPMYNTDLVIYQNPLWVTDPTTGVVIKTIDATV
jgi:hypothetical protein